jgi:hypothetical protein
MDDCHFEQHYKFFLKSLRIFYVSNKSGNHPLSRVSQIWLLKTRYEVQIFNHLLLCFLLLTGTEYLLKNSRFKNK